ncbi:unnamed protein product [Psylliodes chrysocephalus]|uniref:Major facilitator superfamily (MFS) profile domain-containing protein n=1 Tax=Psylliodes chrysocephalus TaxID=3402493 RepID=A0A9P0CGP7_9CUCU|nr:unnamed protein product [Psylliodes chrysocephala]
MPFNLLKCTFGKCVVYQRYIMVIFMQLALLNSYHLRMVLNIAITEMVAERNLTSKVNECPQYTYEKIEEVEGGTFPWDNEMEAIILYAFFTSSTISHIPGGWLADKIGGRHVMGTCLVISSLATIAFPTALQHFGSTAAIILRMILGFAQGPVIPTITTFIQCWIPKYQRAFLGGVAYGGYNLGTVTGSIFTGMIIKRTGSWMLPFYVWGFSSLVFCCFFYLFVFSRPSTHPFITEEELTFLETEVESRKSFKVPWWKLCTSVPVWALLVAQYAHNFIFFTLLTNLPKYLKEILKMNVQANAVGTALPFLGLWLSVMVFAYITDWLINRNLVSIPVARKVNTSFSCIFPSFLILVAVYIGCNRAAAVALYTSAITFLGPFTSGMQINVNEVSIHYGGTIMAIVNGIGSTAGILGPYMVGALTEEESFASWKKCFWVIFAVSVVASAIYITFAEFERQSWDFVDDE